MLCKLLKEAGLPDGVVNMVFGTGPKVGEILVQHSNVNVSPLYYGAKVKILNFFISFYPNVGDIVYRIYCSWTSHWANSGKKFQKSFVGGNKKATPHSLIQLNFFSRYQLGGKNAAIIFEDADLSKVIPSTVRSCFLNQGEICLCTSRIFVQRSLYSSFVERLVEEAR